MCLCVDKGINGSDESTRNKSVGDDVDASHQMCNVWVFVRRVLPTNLISVHVNTPYFKCFTLLGLYVNNRLGNIKDLEECV